METSRQRVENLKDDILSVLSQIYEENEPNDPTDKLHILDLRAAYKSVCSWLAKDDLREN